MAYVKRKSLIRQVQERFEQMQAFGESKYAAKLASIQDGTSEGGHIQYGDKIYSVQTMRTYLHDCCDFANWCKIMFGARDLADLEQYADRYLQEKLSEGCSVWSVKTYRSAIAKMLGKNADDFAALPVRHRADIKRGRSCGQYQAGFATELHPEMIAFVSGTGLRRAELDALRVRDVDSSGFVTVQRGKGGKRRVVQVLPECMELIRKISSFDGDSRVMEVLDGGISVHPPKRAPLHSYRRDYAQALYRSVARDAGSLGRDETYCPYMDMDGLAFDKKAVLYVSEMLGHSRSNVVVEHYFK